MGLDGIEMIMTVEEAFQIVISDEEAQHLTTPAKLCDFVYSKLRKRTNDPCPSQHGFYIVRKAIMEALGMPRNSIKPKAKLEEIMPIISRRKSWKKILSKITNKKISGISLKRPKVLKGIIFLSAFLLIFPYLNMKMKFNFPTSFWWAIISILFMFLTTWWAAIDFPKNFVTIGDLGKLVGTLNCRVWEKNEVYQRLKTIISEQLSIPEEIIQPDSDFVNDLGMG